MANELKKAQRTLTEETIRILWTKICHLHPEMCIQSGIRLDFEFPITERTSYDITNKLLRCSNTGKIVATPIYGFNYDPPNENPHHVTALTLCYDSQRKRYLLNYFNPKGRESTQREREIKLLASIGYHIQSRTNHVPVIIHYYDGKNLQKSDNIGLCQLYSLYYLLHFLHKSYRMRESRLYHTQLVETPCALTPSQLLQYIEQKNGPINQKQLEKFWLKLSNTIKNDTNL